MTSNMLTVTLLGAMYGLWFVQVLWWKQWLGADHISRSIILMALGTAVLGITAALNRTPETMIPRICLGIVALMFFMVGILLVHRH